MKKFITVCLVCFMSVHSFAQQSTIQRTINVNGSAQMEVTPDEIYVNVLLREYNRKNGEKIDLTSIRTSFLLSCTSIGLKEEDVTIVSYEGNTSGNWWIKKCRKEIPDMKASITYQVKFSSVVKMNELADQLDDEATENFYITKVWHSQMESYKKQLKIEAIKAAKTKAIYLTAAIDEKLGHAITINDPSEVNVYPQATLYANKAVYQSMDQSASEEAMNVDFKKIKLQFEVSVVFELL